MLDYDENTDMITRQRSDGEPDATDDADD